MSLEHSFCFQDVKYWWLSHTHKGGEVYESHLPWNFFPPMYEDLRKLFLDYANLTLHDIEYFQRAHITDGPNEIPHYHILERACSVWALVKHIECGVGIKHYPQILHEPWYDQYRILSGKNRIAAWWLKDFNYAKCMYIHFDEPEFEPPPYSNKVHDIYGLFDAMFTPYSSKMRGDIDTYQAFPCDALNQNYTNRSDPSWDWTHVKTITDWNFMRYAEGQSLMESRYDSRNQAFELWHLLQRHETSLTSKLNL